MTCNYANPNSLPAALGLKAAALILLLGFAVAALALEPSTPLANYGRQAWVMENGLPQNTVQALAQTKDGFIWLGTEVGLVRFDGNGFQVFDHNSSPALLGNDVRCLLAAKDGTLWIGTSEGLARWKDGVATAFTTKDGLPGNGILDLWEDEHGSFSVWTSGGPAHQAGNRFLGFRNVDAWPHTAIPIPGEPPEQVEFEENLPNDIGVMGDRSSLTFVKTSGRLGVVAGLSVGKELPGSRIQAVMADREGSLWIGTNGGLTRWAGGKLERFPVTDPLATASVLSLMEDHEGNIWVGTETGGLHILRDQRFRTIGARDGLSSDGATTVVEDGAGTLWVGTSGSGLNAVRRIVENPAGAKAQSNKGLFSARLKSCPDTVPGLSSGCGAGTSAVKNYSVRNGLLSDVILSLAAAPNGDLWVGTPDGLNRIRGSKVDAFTSADGLPDDFIRSLLADTDGSLWIGTRRGLTHWIAAAGGTQSAMKMETFTQASGLGSDLVGAMVRDSHGDLWVATFAGLSRLGQSDGHQGGKIENFTTANGLSSNVITALLARSNGTLLIGTQDHGWDQWDGHKFSAVAQARLDQTTIHAILDDGRNHLWFATGNGIARCDCSSMGAAMAAAGCSHWIEFGTADGLRSRETATNSHPSAWRSRDAHLWFATPKGLVEVDPEHFPVNTVPPPVALERFAVDDVDQPLRGAALSVVVPAGHVHFQFDYAGLSFTAPQKVRYRYMLEGFDKGWTEAGTRRTAYYTSLPPRRYTFRVQAANNDGVWNTAGAALTFELRPHFYQTAWFYLLLSAALAGLIVLLLRRRLKRAESEFRAVLGERNRIAREIHDTLAQGYVGVSVQLEVLAELLRMSKVEAAAKQLDQTRGYVREGLADARQSIWALRSQDSGETTLPVRLRRMVEAAREDGLATDFSIFGAYRGLDAEMEREILRVAQEAIHNVKKHAGAKHLFVQLEYGPSEIALEVRDDGRGFVAGENLESHTGHYGLTGMRERAAAIGGTLEVTSEREMGTTVRLVVISGKDRE
jgi:signal transduction histidine kinase/ligand-binding sensor domain-containing protein